MKKGVREELREDEVKEDGSGRTSGENEIKEQEAEEDGEGKVCRETVK